MTTASNIEGRTPYQHVLQTLNTGYITPPEGFFFTLLHFSFSAFFLLSSSHFSMTDLHTRIETPLSAFSYQQ
jgi:hypothetical protein